jgi:alkyl sulfatase BDS1-like metallo-beta-lactamase superfamily hydrolase
VALGLLAPEDFGAAGVELVGDISVLGRLVAVLEEPNPDFAIVTPD